MGNCIVPVVADLVPLVVNIDGIKGIGVELAALFIESNHRRGRCTREDHAAAEGATA